jgi:hypothetical protein
MEARMETKIPTELIELKARFDQWRKTRRYSREPVPDDLRQAAIDICRQCPRALVRRVLKVDPWRLNQSPAKTSALRKQSQKAFFQLPVNIGLLEPASAAPTVEGCRLQFERSDGSRLTLLLPELDLISLNRLAADFLRGSRS